MESACTQIGINGLIAHAQKHSHHHAHHVHEAERSNIFDAIVHIGFYPIVLIGQTYG